jgi:transposase
MTMPDMTWERTMPMPGLRVGVDTHADVHVAVAIDELGRRVAHRSVPTTAAGFTELLEWATGLGPVVVWGVEGTGSYGMSLVRFLRHVDMTVVEVCRPDRRTRRDKGKSDLVDAEAAARTVLGDRGIGEPKSADGPAESLRQLRAARRSAVKASTQASHQLSALMVTAPIALRGELAGLTKLTRARRCAGFRPRDAAAPGEATKHAMRFLARRWLALREEIAALDRLIGPIVTNHASALLERPGVGPEVATTLMITVGDNPHRLGDERRFAALCGVSPIPASSGKTNRHRLNRGGDRHANAALHQIVLTRMKHDPRTIEYVQRRTKEGRTQREIMRCLKRYVAREIYPIVTRLAS